MSEPKASFDTQCSLSSQPIPLEPVLAPLPPSSCSTQIPVSLHLWGWSVNSFWLSEAQGTDYLGSEPQSPGQKRGSEMGGEATSPWHPLPYSAATSELSRAKSLRAPSKTAWGGEACRHAVLAWEPGQLGPTADSTGRLA